MTGTIRILFLCLLSLLLTAACSNPVGQQANQRSVNQGSQVSSAPGIVLNSEQIRHVFGSYGIEIVEQNDHQRISDLYSIEHDQKITRTLAVVFYPQNIPLAIKAEHDQILSGGSIGEVFKQRGWNVEKTNLYFGEMPSSSDFDGVYAAMGEIKAAALAIHVYQLSVKKTESRWFYATIAEVHHPGYLNLSKLQAMYELQNEDLIMTQSDVRITLDAVSRVMQDY